MNRLKVNGPALAQVWQQRLLVFASGCVMGIIPAPVNAWYLAWVALVPLWRLLYATKGQRRQAFLLGGWWGLGFHGTALSWILGLHPLTWMGFAWGTSLLIAVTCWVLVTLWGALIPALWSAMMAWLCPRQSLGGRLLIGATLWCSLEWIWTQSPLWWTTLAYTQSPGNLMILHLGQVAGTTAITAAILVVNGLWAECLRTPRRCQRYGLWAAALLLGLHLLGYGLYRVPLQQTAQDGLRVGIIQGNVPTRIKLTPGGIQQGLDAYIQGYQTLVRQGVDAVLMPEGALPIRWQSSLSNPHPLTAAVRSRRVVAWLGTFMPQGQNRITQSLIELMPTGGALSRYNKVKLVPLGEYIPFTQVLGQLLPRLSTLGTPMVPGQSGQVFKTSLGQAAVGICFDSAFPNLFRDQVAAGGTFILTASNNDPYSHRMMSQHHAHDVMRAIETDRWVVRATNTGYSGFVDPHGRTQWLSGRLTYEVHAQQIYRRQTETPYVIWGDSVLVLLVLISGGVFVSSTRWGKI